MSYFMCKLELLVILVMISLSLGINITEQVFGDNTNFLPAAFGDFNSDKLTDLFVVSEDRKTVQVLISHLDPPLLRQPGPSCTSQALNIISVVPSDFDGNGAMDVLLVSLSKGSALAPYQVFVLWGSQSNMTLDCSSMEGSPLLSLHGQPLVMDRNGDMIPDLFGEDENKTRAFWIFDQHRKQPRKEIMSGSHPPLRLPSSHAFVDLNGDLAADLWVTSKDGFEVWKMPEINNIHNISLQPFAKIGQTSFADVNLDGSMEVLVPVCKDESCKESFIYILDSKFNWIELEVNFTDPNGKKWKYPPKRLSNFRYTDTVTLRVGDYNLDGFPDILVTLVNSGEDQARVILMENVACVANTCGEYQRKFIPQWALFEDFGNTVLGTFCDIQEDGTLEVLLLRKDSGGKYLLAVYKDASEYDATFVKVLILTGRCYGDDCEEKNIPYGTNQPGPSITYSITTATGDLQSSRATQLAQSAHDALQLPYTVFGLGRNWNFVEKMTVGIPKGNNSQTLTSSFSQIIPNSQLIVIPYPMAYPDHWVSKLFITPSKAMLKTAGTLIGTCLFVAVIIGILHHQEKKQDKREKQQEAHKFHFDAM